MPMVRQTLVIEYPSTHFAPYQAGQMFTGAKVISATRPERQPDRSLVTIKIEIDRPVDRFTLIDEISASILDFLADDAGDQREPLITASTHPEVREVNINSIVT